MKKKAMETALTPLRAYRWKVVLAPCLKLFECATELASPFLVRYIIDEGIAKNNWDTTWKLSSLLFLFAVLGFLVTILAQYLASSVASKYSYDLRKRLFAKVESLSERELDGYGRAKVLSLIGSDSYALQSGVMMFMRLIFRPPFLLIGSTIISFVLDYRAGLIFLGAVLLSALVIALVIVLSPKRYAAIQKDLDSMQTVGNDALRGARPIRAFNKQAYEEAKFDKVNKTYTKNTVAVSKLNAILNPLTFFFMNLGLILIVWLGDFATSNGTMSTGIVVSLISYLVASLAALVMFSRLILSLNKAAASKKRVDSFLALTPSLEEKGNLDPRSSDEEPFISFENVSFTYGKKGDSDAIKDVTFSLKKGETLGLIGGTGSGKSTTMALLCHLYDRSGGTILYKGHPIEEYGLESLHKDITYLSQRPSLFKGTIRSNLLLGKENATEEELTEALKESCAYEFVSAFPDGMNHPVEENGNNLSGGQKQRLLLARSLLRGGSLLILDDAMSALDYLSEQKIRAALKKRKDLTKIIISQRVSSIHDADKILVYENGRILAEGTDASLKETCPLYADFASDKENSHD